MSYELAIRGGLLIDGTGAPPRRADLGISGGRIAEIGSHVTGREEIDARDRLVVPGFVDIHTHYDPQVLWDPDLTPSSTQGVTSVVAGNCGYSLAPARAETRDSLLRTLDKVEDMRLETLEAGVDWAFESYPEYLERVARRGTAIHFGGYVGHTAVRVYVMGDEAYEREATEEEIARMRAVVAASIRGGALGFSTDRAGFHLGDGGRPVPSIVATQEETETLMRVVGELDQGVVHVAAGEDYAWLYDFQRSLGRPLNWSAILTYAPEWTSRAPYQEKLARHESGRRDGADVWVQVTCRPIVQQIVMKEPSPFYSLPAFAELVATPRDERHRLFSDADWRAKVYAQFESHDWINPGWSTFRVAESKKHPELAGLSVAEIAVERGVTPFDVVCDVALDDDLETRFDVTFANDDEVGIRRLLTAEGCILGLSDAGAHVGQICDAVMPTDFLSGWVRDREVMTLEEGIRKLTGEIADVLEIDRGRLREGSPADVVVLDWDRLSPGPIRRVHDMPANGDRLVADAPEGIDCVFVNGCAIRKEGRPIPLAAEDRPGVILRSRRNRR